MLNQELYIVLKFAKHLKLETTLRERYLYPALLMKKLRLKEFKVYIKSKEP